MKKVAGNDFDLQVRSSELDSYQHVNNAAYLEWFEDARERFLRTRGLDYAWFPAELGLFIVVVNIDCDFLSAAKSGEHVQVSTRLAKTGRTSIVFRHVSRRAGDRRIRARARVVMCFADPDDRPVPIPEAFLERFAVSPEGDAWTDEEGGERT